MTSRNDTNPRLTVGRQATRGAGHRNGQYFTVLLFGVFFLLLLLGFWMGITAFRSIVATQDNTDEARLALSSLQNRVRSNDQAGAFSIADGPEGQAMVFSQSLEAGTYETRIYQYQGNIVEETAFAGDAYTPGSATILVTSDTFAFTYQDNLLTVATDQGTIDIFLRTGQGATYTSTASSDSAPTALNTTASNATNAGQHA